MSELSDKLANDTVILITSTHKGFNGDRLQDMWDCKITYEGRSATFSYSTGIGHRKMPSHIKREGGRYWDKYYHVYRTEVEMAKGGISKLPEPVLADVLHCLLSDSSAIGEAFTDWCSNLGYEADSRKALDTYLQCQENGVKLRNVIGYRLMCELAELEH